MGRSTTFCCLALPLVNSGSYGILLLNFLMGIATCAIAFGPHEIVALSGVNLAWTKYLIGIVGILLGVWQAVGAVGISSERPSVFKLYLNVHRIVLGLLFLLAIIFLIVGGAQHAKVQHQCQADYGYMPPVNLTGSGPFVHINDNLWGMLAEKMCNKFIWAQVGCMAGVIVILFFMELYFVALQTLYSRQMFDAPYDSDYKV